MGSGQVARQLGKNQEKRRTKPEGLRVKRAKGLVPRSTGWATFRRKSSCRRSCCGPSHRACLPHRVLVACLRTKGRPVERLLPGCSCRVRALAVATGVLISGVVRRTWCSRA
ncbi:hypothetical protein HPB48_024000 [Haemaphysalis longicornis]|uniref:Uncharacterized protein n=1 Tax=Haemaphysalis longicornis TaxID=44386 RepID=A0A9J6H625_HAELO|nr:hypothetical protein HPB48_024000 [Haemaphysalis longicornis]